MTAKLTPLRSLRFLLFATLLCLECFLLRAPTFLRSVIDWDEGLWMVMADHWQHDQPLYSSVWDIRPAGIFLIFKGAFLVFGRSVFSIRLMTILFVWATALTLYLLGRRLFRDERVSRVAAILYPALSLGLEGLESTTELFYIPFNLLGLLFLLQEDRVTPVPSRVSYRNALFAGLCFGVALQIKYIVAVEVFFFLLCLLQVYRKAGSVRGYVLIVCIAGAGCLVPTFAAGFYFWSQGVFELFLDTNFFIMLHYIDNSGTFIYRTGRFLISLLNWLQWLFALLVLSVLALFKRDRLNKGSEEEKYERTVLSLWLLAALVEAWCTTRFYAHSYLVTLPPLCLFAANLISKQNTVSRYTGLKAMCTVLIGYAVIHCTVDKYAEWVAVFVKQGKDSNECVAEYLKSSLSPEDYLYVVNGQPVLYFLAGANLPTRYVFPAHLLDPSYNRMAHIDFESEVTRILGFQPKFIVFSTESDSFPDRVAMIQKRIEANYVLDRTVIEANYVLDRPVDEVTIYRRVPSDGHR